MITLKELKELSDACPAGPWKEWGSSVEQEGSEFSIALIRGDAFNTVVDKETTAKFIAACVNYVRQELEKSNA